MPSAGTLKDDATSLMFDWHGGVQGDRVSHAGAEHRVQRERSSGHGPAGP